jgi:dsDNA-specific endonuclease/ATPase MutS2
MGKKGSLNPHPEGIALSIEEEPFELPIDGTLDLHTFSPSDLPELLDDYLKLCGDRGIYSIRVIHGKGTGALRKRVHAILAKNPFVISFSQDQGPGGWGATIVELNAGHFEEKGASDG